MEKILIQEHLDRNISMLFDKLFRMEDLSKVLKRGYKKHDLDTTDRAASVEQSIERINEEIKDLCLEKFFMERNRPQHNLEDDNDELENQIMGDIEQVDNVLVKPNKSPTVYTFTLPKCSNSLQSQSSSNENDGEDAFQNNSLTEPLQRTEHGNETKTKQSTTEPNKFDEKISPTSLQNTEISLEEMRKGINGI